MIKAHISNLRNIVKGLSLLPHNSVVAGKFLGTESQASKMLKAKITECEFLLHKKLSAVTVMRKKRTYTPACMDEVIRRQND